MRSFRFVADKGTRQVSGRVQALDIRDARTRLGRQYDRIVSVEPELEQLPSKGRVSIHSLALAVRQFSTLLRAGLPIHKCLLALAKGDDRRLNHVFLSVHDVVMSGGTLSLGLSRHPEVFTPYFLTLIKAGEVSGSLEKVLEKLAVSLERQSVLQQRMISSLSYPALSLALAFGVVLMLIYGVIPVMKPLFETLGMSLPLVTRIVLLMHAVATDWRFFAFLLALLAGAGAFYRLVLAGSLEWQGWWRRAMVRIPVFGPLFYKVAVANVLFALAAMLESGVMVMKAFEVLENLDTNVELRDALVQARLRVTHGAGVAEALEASRAFPSLVIGMIRVGEEAGHLDDMIRRTAAAYEMDVENAQGQLIALTEPLVLILLGGVTGFIVLAAIMPILQLLSSF